MTEKIKLPEMPTFEEWLGLPPPDPETTFGINRQDPMYCPTKEELLEQLKANSIEIAKLYEKMKRVLLFDANKIGGISFEELETKEDL